MVSPYFPLVDIDGGLYYPKPYSEARLTSTIRYGMLPIALLATLSVGSTITLIAFIVSRFITWKRHYRTFVGYNHYVVLVLNLLIADLQQSMAFLIEWHWFRKNQILAPSTACFAQGWLLHAGDVIHTHYTAVYGRRVGNKKFAAYIVFIWMLVYFLTGIGVGLRGHDFYFTAAGAWCWILTAPQVSPAFEVERLWCHYMWIFIVEFGTIAIYFMTFLALRKKTSQLLVGGQIPKNSPNAATIKAVNRITMLMTLYPLVYVVLTLPLSAGRMWSMSHGSKPTSDLFSCSAGALLTSCGWVDSLLYTLTRKRLLKDSMPGSFRRTTDGNWETDGLGGAGITHAQTVTVEEGAIVDLDVMTSGKRGVRLPSAVSERSPSAGGSIDPILLINGLGDKLNGTAKTEITVGHREISEAERCELEAPHPAKWRENRKSRKCSE
ncbi:hypothetical protein AC578_3021 [Pseudocercospora eumusae]|uniref:G protein-coupled receptor GPR1/2/3 C-terminal domain-containing protein n=1 Tax=Pseudocercospora eumusae TaxID=321146 RepID=A0A139H1S8_9PEZI|nr:hypothetical protein AC578_3021 [Pseudocercospora eumusae]